MDDDEVKEVIFAGPPHLLPPLAPLSLAPLPLAPLPPALALLIPGLLSPAPLVHALLAPGAGGNTCNFVTGPQGMGGPQRFENTQKHKNN